MILALCALAFVMGFVAFPTSLAFLGYGQEQGNCDDCGKPLGLPALVNAKRVIGFEYVALCPECRSALRLKDEREPDCPTPSRGVVLRSCDHKQEESARAEPGRQDSTDKDG